MNKMNDPADVYSSSTQKERENNDFAGALKKGVHEVEGKMNNIGDDVSDKMEKALNKVKEKASETQETVIHYVNENPLKSLGIAVLVGAVLGALLRK